MIIERNHGGGCCGIAHAIGFYNYEQYAQHQKRFKDIVKTKMEMNMMVEVAVTNSQLKSSPQLIKDLSDLGFKRVSVFRNGNSNNIVNVFHLIPNEVSADEFVPFKE